MLLIVEVFDCHHSFVKNDLVDLKPTERFKNLFSYLDENQKCKLEKMQYELLSDMLFAYFMFTKLGAIHVDSVQ